jgi:DNA-binding response OmpR family regulator
MTKPLRLVVLDKNPEAARRLADSLSTDGIVVYYTTDPDEALHLVSLLRHDVLLVGVETLISMPFYPLPEFREVNPKIKIVGISRGRRRDTDLLLKLLILDAYVREPVTPEALIISLPEIAERYLAIPVAGTSDRNFHGYSRQQQHPYQAAEASR